MIQSVRGSRTDNSRTFTTGFEGFRAVRLVLRARGERVWASASGVFELETSDKLLHFVLVLQAIPVDSVTGSVLKVL